jgi:CHAD domain-containing protein
MAGVPVDSGSAASAPLRPGVPGLSENIRVRSDPRPLPRALAAVRRVRRRTADDRGLDRQRRPDAPQPRPPGRGARPARYGDLLRDDVAGHLRPELAWYAGVLSPARDLEVFALALERSTEDVHGFGDALLPWLRRRQALAQKATAAELATPRARVLHAHLLEVARTPRFTDTAGKKAWKVLAPRVLRADDRAASMLERLDPGDPADEWHAARIAAKRARYAAEVGAPALGRPCEDLARLWSLLTEPLGEAQDAVIQRALVLDRVDDSSMPLSAGEAFVCGVYVASTHDREVAAQSVAHEVWTGARAEHKALRRAVKG